MPMGDVDLGHDAKNKPEIKLLTTRPRMGKSRGRLMALRNSETQNDNGVADKRA